jgi:hypothetical protein
MDVGNLGKKKAATVNKIGAVSPETLPMDNINPVIILECYWKYNFCLSFPLLAPNPKLACLKVIYRFQ